jgi:tRNA (guanine10-N2)-dimethyltransferase
MILLWVELSLENLPLAHAELEGALAALGAPPGDETPPSVADPLVAVEAADGSVGRALAGRLAFARRVLAPWDPSTTAEMIARMRHEGTGGKSASFRPLRRGRSPLPTDELHVLAGAYTDGGGRIDLAHPERRFWSVPTDGGSARIAEELAPIDRPAYEARRMPHLPFQRPVSLPPRRARAAVNLAEVRPGDRVVDPFVGTGALLLEAALVGARVSGVDRDPDMVRGTLRNLSEFGKSPEALVVGDAGEPLAPPGGGQWDAIVTDPPYGRASGSGGEAHGALIERVLPAWDPYLAPEARICVILPGGPDPLGPPWVRVRNVPDRVHRSLTREFRVFRRRVPPSRS